MKRVLITTINRSKRSIRIYYRQRFRLRSSGIYDDRFTVLKDAYCLYKIDTDVQGKGLDIWISNESFAYMFNRIKQKLKTKVG